MAERPPSTNITLTVNGKRVRVEDHDKTLLDTLRDDLGITSPKRGCQPQGQCGACTVLIDDKPRLSCTIKASQLAGKHVTTLEGLSEIDRTQIGDCFVRSGAVQCGFCTPGLAMRAHALLHRNANPSRAQIATDMRAHLCRCTGYEQIIDAVELLARVRRGETTLTDVPDGRVGTDLPKHDGAALALGDRVFIDDIKIPDMAHAALRFSDHPRALVRRIDTTDAESAEGVIRVVTAADVSGDRRVGLVVSDWPVFVAENEETRCVGDVIAAVLADDERSARRAAALIEIDYDVREPITDPLDAFEPNAPALHAGGNLLSSCSLVRGDVDSAFAGSAHVIEGEWRTQRIEHLFLEPEACIAMPVQWRKGHEETWSGIAASERHAGAAHWPDDDVGLHVLTQGQGIFDDRRQCAAVLGWPAERMRFELISNGGAFGGKEDLSIQAQTCLLAALARRAVKTVLNREESMRLHPKRHPVTIRCKLGCDASGRLTALRSRVVGDTGAYASVGAKVLERAAGHAAGPYRFDAVSIESLAVYTNNPPSGAMRGFGVNQAAFAIESCLDQLAEKVGIDGWEIRSRNILEPGDTFCTGQRLDKPFGLRRTLDAVKDAYRGAPFAGIACGIKNVGVGGALPEFGRATLSVAADGRITIRTGFTEMGQGLFTVLIQTAVEETGLRADVFDVTTDTRDDLDCGQTTGSRGTVLGCHGVRLAARKLRADLDAGRSVADLAGTVYRGEWQSPGTHTIGADVENPRTHLTYGFATQVVILDGEGRIRKVIAAHDVGRAINPLLLRGQIVGSVHMGLGYALTENFVVEAGEIQTRDMKACGVLRAHQMPDVEVTLVEEPDADCPYGARGVGEIGLVPTAPAVAAALYSYDGVRRCALPMQDSAAARAIRGVR